MDLDTMVVGDLSETFFPKGREEEFITLENICEKGRIGSGVMQIPNSIRTTEIWNRFAKSPKNHARIHRGDQDFINYVEKQDAFWQELTTRIASAKPIKLKMRKEKPTDLDIVYFHGYPRIPEAGKKYKWVKEYLDSYPQ